MANVGIPFWLERGPPTIESALDLRRLGRTYRLRWATVLAVVAKYARVGRVVPPPPVLLTHAAIC